MRSTKPSGLLRRLSIATGIAIAALAAAATVSQARFHGGFRTVSMGSRTPMMSHGPRMQGGLQKFKKAPGSTIGRWAKGAKTNVTNAKIPPDREGGRHPHGKRPPHLGPIGTGVAIGALDPAGAGTPPTQPSANFTGPPGGRGGIDIPPANEQRFVDDEVVLEFAGNVSPQRVAQLLARHGLTQLGSRRFALTGSTFVLARVPDLRAVRAALARLGSEAILRTGQPNYYYEASQSPGANFIDSDAIPKPTPVVATAGARPAGGDPAQYALTKLRLNEAHALANGDRILVAVIDSGIDLDHAELRGVVADSYDALGKAGNPDAHGTGVAGAIAAHARLLGAAPAARILAIRAFGAYGTSSKATTFAVLKGVEYAASHRARVINMSFAGPADPGLSRQLAAARGKGIVLVAASGNFGPNSPPQYPAADPNVIAVSATDAQDKMFKAANVGPHIAVAAPGVDILLPAPNGDYQVASGTSFAAAYVSGVAALVLQRAPGLSPDAVRQILESTATDLGPRGKDKQYGSGLVDAYRAIMAVPSHAAGLPQDVPQPVPAR